MKSYVCLSVSLAVCEAAAGGKAAHSHSRAPHRNLSPHSKTTATLSRDPCHRSSHSTHGQVRS